MTEVEPVVQSSRRQVVHPETFPSGPVDLRERNSLAAGGTPKRMQDEPPRVTLLEGARLRQGRLSTQESYLLTIRRFLRFSSGRHTRVMGGEDIRTYLRHLAIDPNVPAANS